MRESHLSNERIMREKHTRDRTVHTSTHTMGSHKRNFPIHGSIRPHKCRQSWLESGTVEQSRTHGRRSLQMPVLKSHKETEFQVRDRGSSPFPTNQAGARRQRLGWSSSPAKPGDPGARRRPSRLKRLGREYSPSGCNYYRNRAWSSQPTG